MNVEIALNSACGEGSRGNPDTQACEVNLLECDTHDSVDQLGDQISGNIVDHGNGNDCCNRSGESKPESAVGQCNDGPEHDDNHSVNGEGHQLTSGTGVMTKHGMNGAEATLQSQEESTEWIQVNRGSRRRAK